jgi:penicillin-binding protein 1A
LSDWIFKRERDKKRGIDWLALDAYIDSSLFGSWEMIKDRWADLTAFNQRFNIGGFPRLANELLSEAFSIGAIGLALMLGLAHPAFEVVAKGDVLAYSKYAVTFQDADGNELGKRGILRSDAVPLEEMPDNFIKALLATEDRRFFEHYGVDIVGTARAMLEDARQSEARQGGSSITQQLAKNVFLSSEKSIQRKIKEAFLAVWLEAHYSKHDILKLYLERAYMGAGAFGAEAAAQVYFGKSIRAVTLAEAADQVFASCQSCRSPQARRRRAHQLGRCRLHDRSPGPRCPHSSRDPRRQLAARQPRLVSRLGVR